MTTRQVYFRDRRTGRNIAGLLDDEIREILRGKLETARAAVAKEPLNPLAWKYLGGMLGIEHGPQGGAAEAHAQAIHLGLDDAAVWHNLGVAYLERGDLVPALCMFGRASVLDPEAPRIWQRLGEAQLRVGDVEKAIQAFERATRLAPEWPETWVSLAAAYFRAQRYPDACAALRMALSAEGVDLPENHTWKAAVLKRLATSEYLAGNRDMAVAAMRESIALWPVADCEGRATAYALLAGICVVAERHAESTEAYEAALALDPGNPAHLEQLVHEYRSAGEPDLAQGALWRLYGVDADRARALEGIGA